MDSDSDHLLKAALWYARTYGWPVFPCKPGGKDPLTRRGFKDASTDPEQIRAWWRRWPSANLGIATGAPGPVVIDIDPPHGGETWLDAQDPALLATLTAASGGGGWHKYYLAPGGVAVPSTVGRLAPGIDTRGAGGYIIAPPSLHPSGALYRWSDAWGPRQLRPVVLPAPYLTALQDVQRSGTETDRPVTNSRLTALQDVQRPSVDLLIRLAEARTEGRNAGGFWLACQLRDNAYRESEAEAALRIYQDRHRAGDHPYTWREAQNSLTQAYRRGPRTPWPVRLTAPQDVQRSGTDSGPPGDEPPDPGVTAVQDEGRSGTDTGTAVTAADELLTILQTLAAELAAARLALERETAAHVETRAQLTARQADVQWTHDLMRTANVSAGVLRTMYFTRWEIDWQTQRTRGEPGSVDEAAPPGPVPVVLSHIAEVSQQSPAVVGRHLKQAAALGLIGREETRTAGPDGQVRTAVAVQVDPVFFQRPSTLAPEAPVGWGGKRVRRCESCGSAHLRTETLVCQDCGHSQPADESPDLALADALLAAGAEYATYAPTALQDVPPNADRSNGETPCTAVTPDLRGDPPDPAVIAPQWGTPPDTAPPQPAHVGACGHAAQAVAWDAATIRWRCRSCWALHRT